MAATRKLQAEIDRCMKKVAEGVEKFEETWQKVHNASNTNQKEKYEEDLKKEIKKLQRLRDQIKTWLASGEIKDKTVLMEKRKLIEMQMERFKVVERETKTKAYSKEGLTSGTKLDPVEKERSEIGQWLNFCLDSLNLQIDQFEAEIETLANMKKRKNRSAPDNAEKIEEFQNLLEKHRDHVQKLETLLRMLDNETVDINQIKDVKDDVEYYIENCQESDFVENELVYDDIDGLEEMLLDLSNVGGHEHNTNSVEASETMSTNSASSPIPYAHNHSIDQLETEKRRHKSSSDDSKGGSLSSGTSLSGKAAQHSVSSNAASSMSVTVSSKSSATASSLSSISAAVMNINTNGNVSMSMNNTSTASLNKVSSAATAGDSFSGALIAGAPSSLKSLAASGFSSLTTTTTTPNNSSPSSGDLTTANHVGSSSGSSSSSSKIASSTTAASGAAPTSLSSSSSSSSSSSASSSASTFMSCSHPPNFAAAVQQHMNGHATSLSEPRNSPPPPAPALSSTLVGAMAPASSSSSGAGLTASSLILPSSSSAVTSIMGNGPQSSTPSSVADSLLPSLKSMAQEATNRHGLALSSSPTPHLLLQQQQQQLHTQVSSQQVTSSSVSAAPGQQVPVGTSNISHPGLFTNQTTKERSQKKTEAHIPPLLGVAPLGPVPLNKETQMQYAMLEAAFTHMPHPSDSERLRPYLPRNPCTTPAHYPQLPSPGSDTIEFFKRLSTETLFFIFYYMEGTKAQYLAARALKKLAWRFHTKYLMWFQRHDEPKIINDEYEQGTYVYFDFEKWGQKRKEGFTFEYRFLEDRDLA